MNTIALFLMLIGIFFIIIGYYKNYKNCPPTKIEYRYIPRSFWDEYNQDDNTLNEFYDLFEKNSPLEAGYTLPKSYNIDENTNTNNNTFNNFNNLFHQDSNSKIDSEIDKTPTMSQYINTINYTDDYS